jgi:hypothetical protein
MIAGLAVLPMGLPAAAAEPDPVYAAIDEHRKAHATHLAAIDEGCRLEELGGDWITVTERPCCDENAAFDRLLGAEAMTLPGLLAKLAYLRGIAQGDEAWMIDEREGAGLLLIDSFTASLKNVGVRA